ncbi:MAG: PTS sugar transporter subunit IIA [Atopobiaceae bacterium]|jgi:PTS system glucose-specific IIA component
MGIFSRILSSNTEGVTVPKSARFETKPGTVYVPVSGLLIPVKEVGDKTIAEGMFGAGVGILPMGNVLYAPADGRVKATTVTNHAIGITTADGADILMHIGVDTVKLNGKGFCRFVEAGETVVAGQPLIAFDNEKIVEAGYEDTVIISITNSDDEHVASVAQSRTKIGGKLLLKVGDPLLEIQE